MKAKIISGFPGVGKSVIFNTQANYGLKILDSDSSEFSWSSPGERHPEFPSNYIKHIKNNLALSDIIMVSTHKDVLDGLATAGIDAILVYPERDLKEEYLHRYRDRGSNAQFVEFISNNWDKFIDGLEGDIRFSQHVVLKTNQFMKEVVSQLRLTNFTKITETSASCDICIKEKPYNELIFMDIKGNQIERSQGDIHKDAAIHTTLCIGCLAHPLAGGIIFRDSEVEGLLSSCDRCLKEKRTEELAFFDSKGEKIGDNESSHIYTTLCLSCKKDPEAQYIIYRNC